MQSNALTLTINLVSSYNNIESPFFGNKLLLLKHFLYSLWITKYNLTHKKKTETKRIKNRESIWFAISNFLSINCVMQNYYLSICENKKHK